MFRGHLESAFQGGILEAVFDLTATSLITSMGLGFLAEVWKMANQRGARVRIESPNPTVKRLLEHVRLEELFSSPASDTDGRAETMSQLNRAMAQDIHILERLSKVFAAVLQRRDRDSIAREILQGLLEALGARRGAYFVYKGGEDSLSLLQGVGIDALLPPETATPEIPPGSAEGMAIFERRTRWTAVPGEAPAWSPLMDRLGFEAAILAPVVGEKGALGLVVVEVSPCDVARLAGAMPLVEAHAGLCGLAMEKAELLVDLQDRNASLQEALLRLGQAQAALNDSGKLATLGALVSGLGHTLNNRLSPILGYAQLFKRRLEGDPKMSRQLDSLESAARDLKHILEKLILVTRGRPPRFEPGRINDAIESALALAEPSLATVDVRVRRHLAPDLPSLSFDRQFAVQAFLSILHRTQQLFPKNALDKWIDIESAKEEDGIRIVLADNGLGLGGVEPARLVDPLEPLHRIGTEEVFNLSVPASVFQKHGGSLEIMEREGGGSIIRIHLPVIDRPSFRPPVAW